MTRSCPTRTEGIASDAAPARPACPRPVPLVAHPKAPSIDATTKPNLISMTKAPL
jgi:hypothetical protein